MLVGAFGLSLKVELMTRDTNDLLKVKNRISFFLCFEGAHHKIRNSINYKMN